MCVYIYVYKENVKFYLLTSVEILIIIKAKNVSSWNGSLKFASCEAFTCCEARPVFFNWFFLIVQNPIYYYSITIIQFKPIIIQTIIHIIIVFKLYSKIYTLCLLSLGQLECVLFSLSRKLKEISGSEVLLDEQYLYLLHFLCSTC